MIFASQCTGPGRSPAHSMDQHRVNIAEFSLVIVLMGTFSRLEKKSSLATSWNYWIMEISSL